LFQEANNTRSATKANGAISDVRSAKQEEKVRMMIRTYSFTHSHSFRFLRLILAVPVPVPVLHFKTLNDSLTAVLTD
jgi:hypothetical protein